MKGQDLEPRDVSEEHMEDPIVTAFYYKKNNHNNPTDHRFDYLREFRSFDGPLATIIDVRMTEFEARDHPIETSRRFYDNRQIGDNH